MHILIDFGRKPEEARDLWTPDTVKRYLEEAVTATGLTRFGPEVALENGDLLLGFQMVAESHVSVHADRRSGRGWADVFSCKDVPPGLVAFAIDCSFGGWQSVRCIPRTELSGGK